jgi:SAM-dependent methyltransferase
MRMSASERSIGLSEQLDYYRARAAEYDEWWLRRGRYDHGRARNAEWFREAAVVSSALAEFRPVGRVLELACGTGIWSERLLRVASRLTALDGSPEMLALNDARLRSPQVQYIEADLFQWRPTEQYDVVFFGFWLSHVPPQLFAEFWQLVASCLTASGRVFLWIHDAIRCRQPLITHCRSQAQSFKIALNLLRLHLLRSSQ